MLLRHDRAEHVDTGREAQVDHGELGDDHPHPLPGAELPPAFAQIGEHCHAPLAVAGPRCPRRQHEYCRDQERRRVDRQSPAGAHGHDEHPERAAPARSAEFSDRRIGQVDQRIGGLQPGTVRDLRDETAPRREKRCAGPAPLSADSPASRPMGAFGKEKPGQGALGRAGHQVRAHHEPVAGKPVGESAAEEQEDDLGDRRGAITTPSLVAESPAWPKRQMPARSAPWTCRAASQRARPGHSGTRAHAGGRDRAAPSPLARHSRTLPPGSQSGQATDYRATGQHATLHSAATGKYTGTLARACQNYVHDRRVGADHAHRPARQFWLR